MKKEMTRLFKRFGEFFFGKKIKIECNPDIFDAVEFGDLEAIKMYWTEDINIDYQDLNGMTLLMFACYYGFEEIVQHLLTFRPNTQLKNAKGKTAFDLAEEGGKQTVCEILIKHTKT